MPGAGHRKQSMTPARMSFQALALYCLENAPPHIWVSYDMPPPGAGVTDPDNELAIYAGTRRGYPDAYSVVGSTRAYRLALLFADPFALLAFSVSGLPKEDLPDAGAPQLGMDLVDPRLPLGREPVLRKSGLLRLGTNVTDSLL